MLILNSQSLADIFLSGRFIHLKRIIFFKIKEIDFNLDNPHYVFLSVITIQMKKSFPQGYHEF